MIFRAVRSSHSRPSLGGYLAVTGILIIGVVSILVAIHRAPAPFDEQELVWPMVAMFGLTAAIWLLMVLSRNGAVLMGAASVEYFRDYKGLPPREWIERPARTFNNLMQVPTLFYVVALLLIALRNIDRAQIYLAWIFVVTRAVHAIIYIGFNHVPCRFATYAESCITLGTMWARFALSLWHPLALTAF